MTWLDEEKKAIEIHGVEKHVTSMTHLQREELIRILEHLPIEVLARMTDSELFEQWLYACEYEGGVNHAAPHPVSKLR